MVQAFTVSIEIITGGQRQPRKAAGNRAEM
jgi:hypothetical protein